MATHQKRARAKGHPRPTVQRYDMHYRVDDAVEFEQLFGKILEAYCTVFQRSPSAVSHWLRKECLESDQWLVLRCQGEILGIGCWRIAEDPTFGVVQLRHIGVAKNPRARGLGRRIVGRLEHFARLHFHNTLHKELQRFFLLCRGDNAVALNMYAKCSYMRVAKYPGYFGGIDAIVFQKETWFGALNREQP